MAFRSSFRRLQRSVARPRLTLYTGGPECSLCEVAKEELRDLRMRVEFDLTYFNIRDPPVGTSEFEGRKWRRLYQYDIPVLHLEDRRIQKHRIDPERVMEAIDAWRDESVSKEEGTQ